MSGLPIRVDILCELVEGALLPFMYGWLAGSSQLDMCEWVRGYHHMNCMHMRLFYLDYLCVGEGLGGSIPVSYIGCLYNHIYRT